MAIPRKAPTAPGTIPAAMTGGTTPIKRTATAPATAAAHVIKPAKFVKSSGAMMRRMIISVTGEEKSGKNHFAFTAPAPIYVHSYDIGIDGVIQKFHKKKDIYVASYELEVQPGEASAQAVAESADKLWAQFVSNYRDGLASCGNGTSVIDTDTEAWELLRLARFGKLTQIMPHMYGPVNAEFRDLLREAHDHKANVFLLSKYVDEWTNYVDPTTGREKGTKTGNKVRKGFSDLPFQTQVNGLCERTDNEGGGSDFKFTIWDCRFAPEANGLVTVNDYDTVAGLVFGD